MQNTSPNQENAAATHSAAGELIDAQVLRELLNLESDGIFIVDHAGVIVLVNREAEQMFGYAHNALIGREATSLMSEHLRERHAWCGLVSQARRPQGFGLELLVVRQDGSEFPAEISLSILEEGARTGYAAVVRDITNRKLEEGKLRDLTARLLSIREEERIQVSRAIHDEFGQALTGLKMDVAWLRRNLLEDDTAAQAKLRAMTKLIDDTILSVRQISSQLRPAVLDDIGLSAAMEWQLRECEARTGILCKFDQDPGEIQLDGDVATAAFRIFQEALTNVARHAAATRIKSGVKVEGDMLLLHVQDNGRGISDAEANDPKSLGLLGMRERARLVHGEVRIHGVPEQGTTVEVRLPIGGVH